MVTERQKQNMREKLPALVKTKFGGNYSIAFRHYADRDGKVSKDGVKSMLRDAGIGSILTRWAWVRGVVAELDSDGDGLISWPEFEAVFERKDGISQGPAAR
jgi:Ca2+-binding EF-hand superfamily protein